MAETTGYSYICLACGIMTKKKTKRVLSKESNEPILLLLDCIVLRLNEGERYLILKILGSSRTKTGKTSVKDLFAKIVVLKIA